MRLDELESALREAAAAEPPVAAMNSQEIVERVRRRRRRILAGAAAVALVVTLAVAALRTTSDPNTTVVAGRDTPVTRPAPGDPVPVQMSREEVIEWVRGRTFGRVDRVEAKLVTWGEYRSVRPEPFDRDALAASDTFVWVVVVAGDLRAPHPPLGQNPAFSWGVWVVRAGDAVTLVSGLAPEGTWPSWYGRLVDRSADAQVQGAGADARARCRSARGYETAELVAAYDSTVGEVRAWTNNTTSGGGPTVVGERWPDRPADQRVAVCWFDGAVAKSPPGEHESFNRSVVIVNEHGDSDLVVAGYRENLVPAPPR